MENAGQDQFENSRAENLHGDPFMKFLATQTEQSQKIASNMSTGFMELSNRSEKSNEYILKFIESSNKRMAETMNDLSSRMNNTSFSGSNSNSNSNSKFYKSLDFMRRDPPDVYVYGTNLYTHLVLMTDRYLDKYSFSKAETAHCLALVFESLDDAKRAKEIALKFLPEVCDSLESRKPVYRKIAKAICSRNSSQIEPRKNGEKLMDVFCRIRTCLEINFHGSQEELNFAAAEVLTDQDKNILDSETLKYLSEGLTKIIEFENLEHDAISNDRVHHWLRTAERSAPKQSGGLFYATFSKNTGQFKNAQIPSWPHPPQDSSQPTHHVCLPQAPTAPVVAQNVAVEGTGKNPDCKICHDSPRFSPHTTQNCPSRGKCIICVVIRGADPEKVFHYTENHTFKSRQPGNYQGKPKNSTNQNTPTSPQPTNPSQSNNAQPEGLHFVDDAKYENFPNSLNFVKQTIQIGSRSTNIVTSTDRRYHLLELKFPSGVIAEAKVDTGATMSGIISKAYVEILNLSKYACTERNSLEIANGGIVQTTEVVKCFVMCGDDIVFLKFIVLPSCNAGLLIGRLALRALGIDQAFSEIVATKNESL